MLSWLKLYYIEFLKVKLTHPDNATGGRITPACLRLNWTQTDLSNLHMINSSRSVFNLELQQQKFVEESWEENKNPPITRRSVDQICTKSTV